jgi:hypothetical protein
MVDESTNMKITLFFKANNGMCEPACELVKKWKGMKIEEKCLIMNNAGENKFLQQRCESKYWQFAMTY